MKASRCDFESELPQLAMEQFEVSSNQPEWMVGFSIGVSKRVNLSFISDYVDIGLSQNDQVIKEYIESCATVISYLLQIEEWKQVEGK